MLRAMECRDLLGNLIDYLDGEAEASLCAEIERHLAACPDCRVIVDTTRKTITLYRAYAPPVIPDDVRRRLYRVLNIEDFIA
ncbi:MAG: zf-HC2 domain-containing protein [Chloroflexi bacterium]|nr:MAG: zf-HC2 domain-containing protein [Chloroflexota bacterium]